MKRSGPFFVLFIAVLLYFPAYIFAFSADVSPKKISQGDVFLVTVKGATQQLPPSASFASYDLAFSRCGDDRYCAVGAADINTKPGRYAIRVSDGKKKRTATLHVRKKRFSEMRITLPEEKVSPCPEDLEKIARENERLQKIFETVSERLWDGAFMTPLRHEVSTRFGTKRIMNRKVTSVHRGVDIKGGQGDPVHASNSGRVVLSEELFLGGNTIIIDHGQGIYTIYMHLSKFSVEQGDRVSTGDMIGCVGSTGRSTGPHLHFGVKVQNISADPFSLTRLPL